MILQLIGSVIVVIAAWIIIYFKKAHSYWKNKNVFTSPPQLIFGNGKNAFLGKTSLSEEFSGAYKEFRSRNLRYGGYYIFAKPIFLPADIKLIRNILTTDFQHFTDHNTYINEEKDPLTGHLFSQKGAKWRALRIKLTPTFTSGKLKGMFQTLVDTTEGLPVLLDSYEKKNEPFDIKEVFSRYTTDVIASVAFGIECNCLKNPDSEFRMYGKKIFEMNTLKVMKNMILLFAPQLLSTLGLRFTGKDVEKFFMNLVRETAEYRDKNNVERKDFMQLLLNLRNTALKVESRSTDDDEPNGKLGFYQNGLTMNEITAQAFVFFIAGFETSSTTLNFLIYELATNLDIQDRLRNEINEVLAKHDGQITYEAVSEMTFLEKCILETLRKYPAIPVLLRECTKTYKVPDSDLVIPKGTHVFIPVYGIHHDPEYYPDPEKFDPERFSEERKSERPPMTFLAFGEGPRICIGLRLGVLQTKVGLVAMLKKYKFTLNSKTMVPLKLDPQRLGIISAIGGIWVDAHKI